VVNLLVSGRVSFHSEALMVEESLLCPPVNQAVVAKKYPYPLVASVTVGETFLYPLVHQGVRFVGAAVAPLRPCPGMGLLMLGQHLERK
jgi:hypothetical protein